MESAKVTRQHRYWPLPLGLGILLLLGGGSDRAQAQPQPPVEAQTVPSITARTAERDPRAIAHSTVEPDLTLPGSWGRHPLTVPLPASDPPPPSAHAPAAAIAATPPSDTEATPLVEPLPDPLPASPAEALDLEPGVVESSPVLQRWLEAVPDVASDIKYDPAFRTRLRVGYAQFPANGQTSGLYVGVHDVFVGRSPLTLSADYSTNYSANGRGDRVSYGVDAQYYILPLGWYGNFGPVLGYRRLETPGYEVDGFNVGFRIVLIPSRTGAADLSLTQTWVAPGRGNEVGLTTFSVGYALTSQLRLSTDIQTQNAARRQDSRVGVMLEWML